MALPELHSLAPWAYLIVGVVVTVLGLLSLRSYRATGNPKLLFVVMAFLVLGLKSVFVIFNEVGTPHAVDEHTEIVLMGFFDVIAVLLLFIPFITPKSG